MSKTFNKYLEYVREYDNEENTSEQNAIEISNEEEAIDIANLHESEILGRFMKGGYTFSNEGKARCISDYFKRNANINLVFLNNLSLQDVVEEIDWEEINADVVNAVENIKKVYERMEEFIEEIETNEIFQTSDISIMIEEWINDLKKILMAVV